jgi:DNA-binding CsgD family transcriptional regulator
MEVRFDTDRKEKENQLLKKDNDLNKLYTALALTSLVSILVIAVLFFNRQRLKINSTKVLAEKEKKLLEVELKNTQLSESQLRNEIEYKNKELTTYTLNLIQKNEILEELKTTLEQIRMTPSLELSGKVNSLINSVNFSFHLDREWDGFKKHFEEVHESFFEKLRTRFPDLNMNDMKLCALLKLNLETKEVATILGISPDSTKVARHRLRKKLSLSTDQNLTSFLSTV